MASAKTYMRPRPIRVAFLVDQHEHWRAMLEAIFADSYGRWGGRFSLIVPCENGVIRPAYLSWLRAYDADIVYSYVSLPDREVERLHEQFGPAFLVQHSLQHRQDRDRQAFRPHLPVVPLSVLSVTAVLTRGNAISAPGPIALVDTQLGTPPSLFLQENFGCYGQSLSPWPIAPDMVGLLSPTIFVPQAIQDDPRIMPKALGEVVATEQELIDRISRTGLRGLAQLSACLTPRIEFSEMSWSRTVNFVVGDSFADRIAFWNGAHHLPAWIDGNVVTLKVSQDDLNNAARFAAIAAIIKNRINVPLGGAASQSQIMVRSASHSVEELRAVAARLQAEDRFNIYAPERMDSVDAPVPTEAGLWHARHHVMPGAPFQTSDWRELTITETTFRPPVLLPRHIRDTPQMPGSTKVGLWNVDIDIERNVDHSWYDNIQHRWRLPRRLRMAGAFTRAYQLHGMGPICMPRATDEGLLSVTIGVEGSPPELRVPTDEIAFRYALAAPRDWIPFKHGRIDPKPGLMLDIRPSDKGRYLTALLRMSGSVRDAREIFLSGFWKQQFEALGATPKATVDRVEKVKKHLKRRIPRGQLASEEDWVKLAQTVIVEARAERVPTRYLRFDRLVQQFDSFREAYWMAQDGVARKARQERERFDELLAQFCAFQNAYWATRDRAAPREENGVQDFLDRVTHEFEAFGEAYKAANPAAAPDDWDAHERRSLIESLTYLCQNEILHQGHEWRCPQCYNNNWVSVDKLERALVCEICGTTSPAPVADPWYFKLNNFVTEGLREQGLLPVIWCLTKCCQQAKASFYFLESHDLYYSEASIDKNKPDAELDLLIVSDGIVRLCEAKSSGARINVVKLAELAKRIRPDVVTLAVMEPASALVTRRVAELQQLLNDKNIVVDMMTLQDGDVDDSSTLPTGLAH